MTVSRPPRWHGEVRPRAPTVVVGLTTVDDELLAAARRFAVPLQARLALVHIDETAYVADHHPDGSVSAYPIDADLIDTEWTTEQDTFERGLRTRLRDSGLNWSLWWSAGNPGIELDLVAHDTEATAIIVGARRGGAWGRLHEWINGSVAAYVIHHQTRPVIVIPPASTPKDQPRVGSGSPDGAP